MLDGGSVRIYVADAWNIANYNNPTKDINSTSHIVILEDGTTLSSLVSDWTNHLGAALTSIELNAGRYEMNAVSFSADNPVLLFTV